MTSEATREIPALRSVAMQEIIQPLQQPSPIRRGFTSALAARTALATLGLGVCVGLPMIKSLDSPFDTVVMPPGTASPYGAPSSPLPIISPSENLIKLPKSEVAPSVTTVPTPSRLPPHVASLCQTQTGTVEGQLLSGKPVLPATVDRPSIFVVSPDRSANQSFSVRPANASETAWQNVFEEAGVGIIGILTSDTQFRTDTSQTVWSKSCEPTSRAAVDEVASRTGDLCRRGDLNLRAVVVYHVGKDGKPEEINRTNC